MKVSQERMMCIWYSPIQRLKNRISSISTGFILTIKTEKPSISRFLSGIIPYWQIIKGIWLHRAAYRYLEFITWYILSPANAHSTVVVSRIDVCVGACSTARRDQECHGRLQPDGSQWRRIYHLYR